MELTEKQIKDIAVEANKQIHKKHYLLRNPVVEGYVPYIIKAYHKIIKKGRKI